MPSKKQYNLVNDDAYDSRIPLYNEEAFQHGITFHAKYIGSLDVPRPSSRVEIVAAMRRIRYEFKAKSIKKRKVSLTVSVDGVKVVPRNKRRDNRWPWEENKFIILHHPIYRIFYVSHDSQDLKIFSYIARDGGTNAFKCNVFKSKKKSQAMRIVRTVGQAFEVCHKLSMALATSNTCEDKHSLSGIEEVDALQDTTNKGKTQGDGASEPNSCDTQEETVKPLSTASNQCSPQLTDNNFNKKMDIEMPKTTASPNNTSNIQDTMGIYHQIQLLKEQLELQDQQMVAVVGQIQLLKDQLSAETNARLEAQAQNHHLLSYNRELLEHIKKLVNHIHEVEGDNFKKVNTTENLIPEPFQLSSPPAPELEISVLQNPRYHTGSDKTSLNTTGRSLFDDKFTADPLTQMSFPNAFSRQLSVPGSFRHGTSSNLKHGVSFNNAGLSLPTSPSSLSFSPNLDAIFKPDNFVCSSPKQTRKGKSLTAGDSVGEFLPLPNSMPHSPSFSQSSPSPGHKKKQQIFNFDQTSAPYSSSSLFNFTNENTENDFKLNNNSNKLPSSADHDSYESHSSNKDSFIAQVTRDLAKMSTADKCMSDSAPNSKLYGDTIFTLFKS